MKKLSHDNFRDILASLSLKTTKRINMFSSLSEKRKSKNIILLKKTKRSSLEVIPSFLCEKKVKARIRSSIHDLK